MTVGIVIPTYKECENLKILLPQLFSVLNRRDTIYFIVDDFSRDNTDGLTIRYAEEYEESIHYIGVNKRSFAYALSTGLTRAVKYGCDKVIQMDADGSHRPYDIPKILDKINDNLVLGIRPNKDKDFDSKFNKYRSKIANFIAKAILDIPHNDITTGFHGFSKKAIEAISPETFVSRGFEVECEIVYRAHKSGIKIDEVPIIFYPRDKGKSKKKLLEPFNFFWKLIEIQNSWR